MATVQGSILIRNYSARLEQAITNPPRNPAYVINLLGTAQQGSINQVLIYFYKDGNLDFGKGDVSPGQRIRVFLAYEDYPKFIDLLRNERPIYFNYSYQTITVEQTPTENEGVLHVPFISPFPPRLEYYNLTTRFERVGEEES